MRKLYHGTSSVNLDCIKTIGLVPGHAKGGDAWAGEHHMRRLAAAAAMREPSVFVTKDVEQAKKFAHLAVEEMGGDPIVVTLHVPEQVFATFVVDELYEEDPEGEPGAWRAHSVDVSCVGEVLPVGRPDPMLELLSTLMRMRAEEAKHHHAARS